MKCRKKPVVIEAVKLEDDYNSIYSAIEFVEEVDMSTSIIGANACVKAVRDNRGMIINTLEGKIKASFGDYIIKGIQGELYPCKPDIFEQTYEPVE